MFVRRRCINCIWGFLRCRLDKVYHNVVRLFLVLPRPAEIYESGLESRTTVSLTLRSPSHLAWNLSIFTVYY